MILNQLFYKYIDKFESLLALILIYFDNLYIPFERIPYLNIIQSRNYFPLNLIINKIFRLEFNTKMIFKSYEFNPPKETADNRLSE